MSMRNIWLSLNIDVLFVSLILTKLSLSSVSVQNQTDPSHWTLPDNTAEFRSGGETILFLGRLLSLLMFLNSVQIQISYLPY